MDKKSWYELGRTIVQAGQFPMAVTKPFIELLQFLITEEQAEFLQVFKKPSLTLEEIKQKTDVDESSILDILEDLMNNGIIIGTKSKRSGLNVYRLLPPFPGIFEYTFLRGETDEKHVKLAKLFQNMFSERRKIKPEDYEAIAEMSKNFPATDRTLPVGEEVEVGTEKVIPFEKIKQYVDEYDDIAVAHCYCRHHKDLIDDPCKLGASKKNCFLFDKSAVFVIEKNFGERVSKEEAMKIFREAEDDGLVHKVFHVGSDINRGIEAICNCCSCCCGILNQEPHHTVSSYLAEVDTDKCVECATCMDVCPMETIEYDDVIIINEENCIGCGVCAHKCPEDAIHLKRTGPRHVIVPPKYIRAN
ncbi:MAG: indolepyruvate ferredoxin oxidoreductase subunit alpha [Promethearchaeota archaeon]|jgi:Pyruvate/2-oxoacid:ferredoxin oxidoreductase delta subunit